MIFMMRIIDLRAIAAFVVLLATNLKDETKEGRCFS
jgi:hypothetical protein